MSRLVLTALVVSTLTLGCGESRQDLFTAGMKVEGEAERGPCKLLYDKQAGANVLSGDQVQACLKMQGEAVVLYDRAAALGLESMDFVRTHEEAKGRLKRLEGMLKMVRQMERPELEPPEPEPPPEPPPAAAADLRFGQRWAPPSIHRTSATMSA